MLLGKIKGDKMGGLELKGLWDTCKMGKIYVWVKTAGMD